MERQFIDHTFSKIVDGRSSNGLALRAANSKLAQLEEVNNVIADAVGPEIAINTLSYIEVRHALRQCVEYIGNMDSSITETDFNIFFQYAESKLLEAQLLIDLQLDYLEL